MAVNLTEQEIVRREKMKDLEAKGIEPFGRRYDRTHKSGEIKALYEEKTKEELADYNNIENIVPGDKLIIPTNEK